jgi:hypothetical protein
VRQIHGRKGEVWTPESSADKLVVYRYRQASPRRAGALRVASRSRCAQGGAVERRISCPARRRPACGTTCACACAGWAPGS